MKKINQKISRSKKELAKKLPQLQILQLSQLDSVAGGFDLEDYAT